MRHVTLLSYNVQLGRRNVQRVDVRRQSYVRLLGPVGPDEGIDLDAFDIVHVPESSSDLRLGRPCGGQLCSSGPGVHLLDIDDEHQRIVLLNLLHRTFGVEWEHQNAGRVQARLFLDPTSALPRIGRGTRLTETDLRWYFGFRAKDRVFGRWKLVVKRTLWTLCELTYIENRPQQSALNAAHMKARWDVFTPLRAAFAAALALPFLSAAPLPADLASAVCNQYRGTRRRSRLTLSLRLALWRHCALNNWRWWIQGTGSRWYWGWANLRMVLIDFQS
jgi:hypothetical protein